MRRSTPVDGFSLAYQHRLPSSDSKPEHAAVLLHGWPGDHTDYRLVQPQLADDTHVVVPDLRGFGASDRHSQADDDAYGAEAQARSIAALIEELHVPRPVIVGYDIGSRIAQRLAADRPDLVAALVLSPPLPGAGQRVLDPAVVSELWYQGFHRSGLAAQLTDGDADRVRAYLQHFWQHWSGPGFSLTPHALDHLVAVYSQPGALTASTRWYQAGPGYVAKALEETAPAPQQRLSTPVYVLWQEHDPLFPPSWAGRLHEFFSDVQLHHAAGSGHFTPVEAPAALADLVNRATRHHSDAKRNRPPGQEPLNGQFQGVRRSSWPFCGC